jgi:long-chain acyl-CoA synthetase
MAALMADRWHDLLTPHVLERANAPALSDNTGADWDFATLDRACDELCDLMADHGLRPGDRVLLVAENCAAAVATLFACSRAGVTVIPVNARQSEPEIDRILAHCQPAMVLFTSAASGDAAAHGARLGARPVTGVFGVLQMATPYSSRPDSDRDVAVMLYTTGTTGAPKGVMLSHANLRFGGRTSAAIRGMVADDLLYGVLPITHVFGLSSIVTGAAHIGAPVRLEARFSPARLLEALDDGVSLLSAVPQMHALVMAHARQQGLARLVPGRLRYVSSGAAPLDPAWKRQAEAFYGVALQNGYGMTESTAGICVTRNDIGTPDVSCGPPIPGVEVMIEGAGSDGTGEVLTRGPHVMKGYYRDQAGTSAVLGVDGWLRTGDLGRLDDQGFLHIMGRAKELIIHGGFNVYPPEVEAALNDHPAVIQCAVVGRMVAGDEKVLAFVQAAPGNMPDVEELRAFVAARLAGYKRPAQIIVATDLPAAPTGKILKHKLLEVFADRLD